MPTNAAPEPRGFLPLSSPLDSLRFSLEGSRNCAASEQGKMAVALLLTGRCAGKPVFAAIRVRSNPLRWSHHTRYLRKKQLDEGIDDTFVQDEGNCSPGEIMGVRPEIEVLSLAVGSSADFRSRIQG
jgi:hypothetical protein